MSCPVSGMFRLILLLLLGVPVSADAQALPLKRAVPPLTWTGCPAVTPPTATVADDARAEAERLAAEATEASILGNNAAALQLLTIAATLDPRSERVAYRRAVTLDQVTRGEEALAEYCRFLGLEPDGPQAGEAQERVAALAAARGFTVSAEAAAAYSAGIAHYEAGRMAQATAAFNEAATAAPAWADAAYNRGVARLTVGEMAAANRDLRRYLELSPGSPDFGAVLDALQMTRQPYNPGAVLATGLLVPGLGHFTTGRTRTGTAYLGAASGMAGIGLLVSRAKVDCLSPPVDGRCPPDQVLGESTTRPLLVPALLGALATGVVGAIDAYRYAQRQNESVGRPSAGRGAGLSLAPPVVEAGARGAYLNLVRLRF
jgi:tetratricopeptide (TPR) repeat protein